MMEMVYILATCFIVCWIATHRAKFTRSKEGDKVVDLTAGRKGKDTKRDEGYKVTTIGPVYKNGHYDGVGVHFEGTSNRVDSWEWNELMKIYLHENGLPFVNKDKCNMGLMSKSHTEISKGVFVFDVGEDALERIPVITEATRDLIAAVNELYLDKMYPLRGSGTDVEKALGTLPEGG